MDGLAIAVGICYPLIICESVMTSIVTANEELWGSQRVPKGVGRRVWKLGEGS